jgi:hypothetical protein
MFVKQTPQQKPYSIEEIHQMVAEGEKQFASGQWQDSNEMFLEIEQTINQHPNKKNRSSKKRSGQK